MCLKTCIKSRSPTFCTYNINATNARTINHVVLLDAQRIIIIDEDEDAIRNGGPGSGCWVASRRKMQAVHAQEIYKFIKAVDKTAANVRVHYVVTRYVAINTNGVPTPLQRDGSDYSASILRQLFHARNITVWINIAEVLSADLQRVLNAFVLQEVLFTEVMELAYFGAKVIHPKTMQPAILSKPQIPIYICNKFNSSFQGKKIFTSSTSHTGRFVISKKNI
eukprot:CAMPEP_0194446624 /NCGR_PEP_ID=MMETSP0176-20130528/128545_1 /TAXON_ID=216777 /ORGANISM="Proboscia alata, Strain PI-D3" /LENGTH=221 /DNA_ID=CAMNT_0039273363 /DNA_START=447 /DNA_END=1112 /DNA_ORIENTATION=+